MIKTILLLISILTLGCEAIPRADGVYINHKLTNPNAIVADFCSAKANKGDTIEFVQSGKVRFSRRIW